MMQTEVVLIKDSHKQSMHRKSYTVSGSTVFVPERLFNKLPLVLSCVTYRLCGCKIRAYLSNSVFCSLDMFSCFLHALYIVILIIYIVLECMSTVPLIFCLFILFCILFSFIVDEDLMVDYRCKYAK